MGDKLKTHISEVFWCNPKKGYLFEKAHKRLLGNEEESADWMDILLDGGFKIPEQVNDQSRQALGILITGPPGTGKSTFAFELAYRWSCLTRSELPPNVQERLGKGQEQLRILYATLEATPEEMIKNSESYLCGGLDKKKKCRATARMKAIQSASEMENGKVNVISFQNLPKVEAGGTFMKAMKGFLLELGRNLEGKSGGIAQSLSGLPDILIIDSLNSVPDPDERQKYYRDYSELLASHPLVIIFILDSSSENRRAEFWEFASDVVIRLDRQFDASGYMGYMIRNIEVMKARFQSHAWGKHQLKIYRASNDANEKNEKPDALKAAARMRSHPYRNEGGIFIFPSIHFVLSRYKHVASVTGKAEYYRPKVKHLDRVLSQGFPVGRCTALVGERGGHKSHLGYVEVLHRILFPGNCVSDAKARKAEKALIVSLRDDEGMTRQTMTKILEKWKHDPNFPDEWKDKQLDDLEKSGLLEITYFPPGYITPEEFFHRLLLSIHRLRYAENKPDATRVTMLFNSLDQLSSRFPLCAKEPIFIPGIIQMLAGEDVSSFFVAAKEVAAAKDEGRSNYYGLDSMAELILEFEHENMKRSKVIKYFEDCRHGGRNGEISILNSHDASKREVVVGVGRFAGGQAAGARGILELIEKEEDLRNLGLTQSDECYREYVHHDLIFIPCDAGNSDERLDAGTAAGQV